jgi:transcriptional antiterminator RfaH
MIADSLVEPSLCLPERSEDPRWFAIQSKPRGEDVAGHTLRTLGIEVLLPKVRRHRLGELRTFAARPLFSGYLFGRFCLKQHLHAVRYSRGVVRVVGSRDQPVPVDEDVIAACRGRMDPEGFVELDEPGFQRGDRLRIETGPFAGFHGVFERELDDQSRVVILLEALQQARLVLDRRHLVMAVD